MPDVTHLRVAELRLQLDGREAKVEFTVPPAHVAFLQSPTPPSPEDLVLNIRREPQVGAQAGSTQLFAAEIWELWQNGAAGYVFLAPRHAPPLRVTIDPSFTCGEVSGDFTAGGAPIAYPLEHLEIRLFVNWLAGAGDVILHASGVAIEGRGYCFAGLSGAGKSTLAAALASDPAVTILGEDQVVLRYRDGRFWIYGTPWHESPTRCAPLGVPLEKLFFLDRTAPPGTAPCPAAAGVARLMQTAFIPYYRTAAVAAIMDRLALLAQRVPFRILSYRLGTEPISLILHA